MEKVKKVQESPLWRVATADVADSITLSRFLVPGWFVSEADCRESK